MGPCCHFILYWCCVISPSLNFFFLMAWFTISPLHFWSTFENKYISFYEKSCWDFYWICLEPINQIPLNIFFKCRSTVTWFLQLLFSENASICSPLKIFLLDIKFYVAPLPPDHPFFTWKSHCLVTCIASDERSEYIPLHVMSFPSLWMLLRFSL